MKDKRFINLLILTTITTLATNMAHPITPMLIKTLNLPTYMFGVFFSVMSLGTFIGSPLFGQLSDKKGRLRFMIIGILGYGISQLGFGLLENEFLIIFFRFTGGFFVTSYLTSSMAYLTDIVPKKDRLKAFGYYSGVSTVGSSLGYLVGGVIGSFNYRGSFIFQFIMSLFIALAVKLFLKETIENKEDDFKISFNIFSLSKYKTSLNKSAVLIVSLIIIFFIANTSYSSSINYYIDVVMNLPPTFNGVFLAIAGTLGFLSNITLTPYISKHFDDMVAFKWITLFLGVSIFSAALIPSKILFFVFIIIFVSLSSLQVPLQQSILTKQSTSNLGALSGLLNASKAFGMVTGSLISGFIFDFNGDLPFLFAAVLLFVSYIILVKKKY